MVYFLDTSALVKRYRQETGTETLDEIFSGTDNTIVICSISMCEVVRAIDKHFQRKELGLEDFQKIINAFYADIYVQRIAILEIVREMLFEANELITKYHLSANDSLILASALTLREGINPIFVCADVRSGLLRAAESCHLSTLNPLAL